jgi:hypothetical protein
VTGALPTRGSPGGSAVEPGRARVRVRTAFGSFANLEESASVRWRVRASQRWEHSLPRRPDGLSRTDECVPPLKHSLTSPRPCKRIPTWSRGAARPLSLSMWKSERRAHCVHALWLETGGDLMKKKTLSLKRTTIRRLAGPKLMEPAGGWNPFDSIFWTYCLTCVTGECIRSHFCGDDLG